MSNVMALGEPDVLLLDFEPETAPNSKYVELHNRLINKTGKQVARRKIGNNTYAERCVDQFGKPAIAVRLHNTRVVIHTAYTVQFNSGGWLTVTTKDRMNAWCGLGISVYSERGTWMVRLFTRDTSTNVPYAENMVIRWSPNGWTTDVDDRVLAKASLHNDAIRASVKRWLDAMPSMLAGSFGAVQAPKFTEVECVSCVHSDRWNAKNVGDEFDNQEHLLTHILNEEYPLNLIITGCAMLSIPVPNMYHNTVDADQRQAYGTVRKALRYAVLTRLLTGVVAISKR